MVEVGRIDYQSLLTKDDLSAPEVVATRRLAFSSRESIRGLRELAARLEGRAPDPAGRSALAVCYWAQGKYEKALEHASNGNANEAMQYVAAKSLIALGRASEARELLKAAVSRGRSGELEATFAEAARKSGDLPGATSAVKHALSKLGGCAALFVEAGVTADLAGDVAGAQANYRKALECNPEYVEALFRLAYIADLHGDEETALDLYRRCASIKPVRSKVLVNLGLLYEEMGRESDAAKCFRLVNQCHPVNCRARLYLKDSEAGRDMYFDEEQQKRRERRNKILETPITDFELSVRSRNCLEKMNVVTVGDLCRISELALLSFKNFGETSLNEIKQVMSSKGLHLGQSLDGEEAGKPVKPRPVRKKPVDQSRLLAKSADDLGLSVRSQHCMQMLGINTLGDLIAKGEKELMAARNFGATSLTEVRKKLAALGLSLSE